MAQETSNKILCFGELLLHFAPDSEGTWLKNQALKIYVGGAEYNVASALSRWKSGFSIFCIAGKLSRQSVGIKIK
jgi:2-dehydro-3-deoxygluconokinase